MMKYYQEITLIPDAEIPPDFLWTKVYAQIHLAFADRENIDHKQIYGVSFPEYADESMGEKARVFAPEEADLKKLDLKKEELDVITFISQAFVKYRSPKSKGM